MGAVWITSAIFILIASTSAANFILTLRRRAYARPHMSKFLRRWKSLRYVCAVITTQKWIRRRLFRGQVTIKFRWWHAHTTSVTSRLH